MQHRRGGGLVFEGPRGVGKAHLLHAAHAAASATLAAYHGVCVEVTGPRRWPPLLNAVIAALTPPQRVQLCQRLNSEDAQWHAVVARSGVTGPLLALCSTASDMQSCRFGWGQPLQVEGRARSVQRAHTHPLPSKPQDLLHVLCCLAEARGVCSHGVQKEL